MKYKQDYIIKNNILKLIKLQHIYFNTTMEICITRFDDKTILENIALGTNIEKIDNSKVLNATKKAFIHE